jgi:predicted metal-dependent HD superfamily phosphohydrolase
LTSSANYEKAIAYALNQLDEGLAPHLTYHNLWHTRDDVMPAVVRLATASGVDADDVQLLRVAAAFHDIGFIEREQGHEMVGLRIAAQKLPCFDFSSHQIERIMGMILATRLPQSPRDLLEEIVADADLDVLGREDFFPRSVALYEEFAALGQKNSWRQWQEQQLNFLNTHAYFTDAAIESRQALKAHHIATLEKNLGL